MNKSSSNLVHIDFYKPDTQGDSEIKNSILNFKTSTIKKDKHSNKNKTYSTGGFLKKKKQNKDIETNSLDELVYDENYETPQPYLPSPVLESKSSPNIGLLTPASSRSTGHQLLPQISHPHHEITPAASRTSATSGGVKDTDPYFDSSELTPACVRDLESTCMKIKRSQEAAKIASRMINMKIATEGATPKSMFPKHLPVLSSTGLSSKINPENYHPIQASPATLARAKLVRACLELHYDMIAAYQDSSTFTAICSDSKNEQDDTGNIKQRGVYNPLRIIRNRRKREALNLPGAQTQAAQLASQQLQSRLLFYTKSPWTIDAFEMVLDYTWSRQLVELREQEKKASRPSKHKKHHQKHESHVHPKKASVSIDPLEESLENVEFHHVDHEALPLPQNFINGGRRKSRSSSTLPDLIGSGNTHADTLNGQRSFSSSAVTLASASTTPLRVISKVMSTPEGLKMTPLSSQSFDQNAVLTPSPLRSDATTVNVKQSPSEVLSDHDSALLPQRAYQTKPDQSSLLRQTCTRRLREYKLYETIYITQYQHNKQQLKRMTPATQGETSSNAIAEHAYADLSKRLSYLNEVLLPKANTMQKAHETEVQLLRRMRLSKLSTRIDILLSDCDQTNNRLSTTLNLEVKKLTEKVDALDRQVSATMHIKCWLWAFVYILLEYLVVCFMWIAWGLVSVFIAGKDSMLITTKAVRWLLWC